MAARIPSSDFMEHAPKNTGEQVRINHTNCIAGEDTRRRLYVKRLQDGSVVAYCHNCGGSGRYGSKRTVVRTGWDSFLLDGTVPAEVRTESTVHEGPERDRGEGEPGVQGGTTVPRQTVRLPKDASHERRSWPPRADLFLRKFGLTDDYRGEAYYSPSLRRVGLVLYADDGTMERVTWRRLYDDDPLPKYVQRTSKDCVAPRAVMKASVDGTKADVLVITEDWVSAKKCNVAGADAFPLLTTKLKPEDLIHLTDEYSRVIVWLDNDNPVVKKNRDSIRNNLSLLVPNVISVSDKSDPKHYSIETIQEVIKNG